MNRFFSSLLIPNAKNNVRFERVKTPKIIDRKRHCIVLILCRLRSMICRKFSRSSNLTLFLAFGITSTLGLVTLSLSGNPENHTAVHGSVQLDQLGSTLQITLGEKAIINWESFSIGAEETTKFIQPSQQAAVLNRVIGAKKSELLGKLSADGKVFLINQHGIVMGKDAMINTAEFIASTQELLDAQFLRGKDLLFKGNSEEEIINLGSIQSQNGHAVLIAHRITNEGKIEANQGQALIGCGYEVLLKPNDQYPLAILVSCGTGAPSLLDNKGTIAAFQGEFFLTAVQQEKTNLDVANQNGRIYLIATGGTMMNSGEILAQQNAEIEAQRVLQLGEIVASSVQVTTEGYMDVESAMITAPKIQIAGDRQLFSSGQYDARGEEMGGTIDLIGKRVHLCGARADASGEKGGGTISVGNADFTTAELYISPSTRLEAKALEEGSAGKIIFRSNGRSTLMEGAFSKVSDSLTPEFEFVDPNQGKGTGFGSVIQPLSSGNIVVTKPGDDAIADNAGAVYLYNGQTGALVSVLTGGVQDDQVGSGGVTALANSENYVVSSPLWNNGSAKQAGAVTWGSGRGGVQGKVDASNSLVGKANGAQIGSDGVTVLPSGNYVVASPNFGLGRFTNVGAVTWGSGEEGVIGSVNSGNSLIGNRTGDRVGSGGVFVLTNGNYVVASPSWGPCNEQLGAITWGDGTKGVAGRLSDWNSLKGSTMNDQIGNGGITPLANGNYVVVSPNWGSAELELLGAVTWCDGTKVVTGVVDETNSLIGSLKNDQIGSAGVTALANGNYVVISPRWGSDDLFGAATWGDGTKGVVGAVAKSNSLVGSSTKDQVGLGGVTALMNGNYVVVSHAWGSANAAPGAVTWGDGTKGITGAVTGDNSLIGTSPADRIGKGGVVALTNGNYVVVSSDYQDQLGAVTWCNGTTGVAGKVDTSNSLVGSASSDAIGSNGVIALMNGNYVVVSTQWNNGIEKRVGAVTWGNGLTGITGTVSSSNSLIGYKEGDQVGDGGVATLTNGNYVVANKSWKYRSSWQPKYGSVTWGNGASGTRGMVGVSNSLVSYDSSGSVIALDNGDYVIVSPLAKLDNDKKNSGAVTWGNGTKGVVGESTTTTSLVGGTMNDSIGSDGIVTLDGGRYVVLSPSWHRADGKRVGAVICSFRSGGISGIVNPANCVQGLSENSGLEQVQVDRVNKTIISRFANESGSGRIRVSSTN